METVFLDLLCFYNPDTGVSIKIEVASKFEQSTQLYQQGGINPVPLEGSGGMLLLKILKFQSPKMRFPLFLGLNWVQNSVFFIQENVAFIQVPIISDTTYKKWTNVHLNEDEFCQNLQRNVWRIDCITAFA